jgi:hypothetical protein
MEIFSEWLKHKSIINIAKHAKLDISKYSAKELEMGMKEELEHGKKNKKFNITKDDPVKTLKIVLAHLKEDPKYYTKLKTVL